MKCDQRYHKKAEEEKRKPHSSKADDKKSKKERKEKKNEKKEKVLFFVRLKAVPDAWEVIWLTLMALLRREIRGRKK